VVVGLALAVGVVAQTGVASAGTVDRLPQPNGVWLSYESSSNQDEDLTITPHADGVVFEDATGPVSTADPDCVQLTPNKVRCSDDDIDHVFVDAGTGVNKVVATVEHATEIVGTVGSHNEFWGTAGPVTLWGGQGGDLLAGGPGDDEINGFGGVDEINGFDGDDTLQGGAGDDTFYASPSADGADEIYGSDGFDIVSYNLRANAVHVSLDLQANDGQPASGFLPGEQDNISPNTETVFSGKGDDVLIGSPLTDHLFGGDGDDFISGHAGNDTVVGQAGSDDLFGGEGDDGLIGGGGSQNVGDLADRLSGGPGDDVLSGSLGDDLLHADPGADDLSGGDGTDAVSYFAHTSPVTVDLDGVDYDDGAEGEGDSVRADVENLFGGTGNDRLTGNAAANMIRGYEGDDEIDGLAGPDALFGGTGGDTLRSQDGAVDSDDCGDGTDTAIADAGDVRIACELPAPTGTTGQPSGTSGQAAGSTAPTAGPTMRIRPGRVRLTRTGAARFRLTCPAAAAERCRGLLKLRRRAGGKLRTVGRRPFALAAGATGTVKVRLKPSARGSIGRRGVRMTAVAVARDAMSAEQRTRRTVRVLRARRAAR
jgi:Ca2+-binding RTX toxin-like protein